MKLEYLKIKHSVNSLALVFAYIMVFGLPWSNALFRIGLYGFLACFMLSGQWAQKWNLAIQSKIFLSAAGLAILAIISLSYTIASMHLAWLDVARYLKLLMVGVLVFVMDSEKKRLRILTALTAGVGILMLPTLLDGSGLAKLLHLPIEHFANQAYSVNYLGKGFTNLVYWRNQIVHGFFVAILCFVSLCAALTYERYRKALILLVIVCFIDITFLIYGRMALISLIVSLMLVGLFYLPSLRQRIIALFMIALIAGSSYFLNSKLQQRVESIFKETQAYVVDGNTASGAGHRLYYWNISLNILKDSVLLGSGAGGFRYTLESTKDQFAHENHSHAHNEYITALSQYGPVGLLLFVAILLLGIKTALRLENPIERRCYSAILIIFSLNCLTDSMLYNQHEGWTLVVTLALIAGATSSQAKTRLSLKNKEVNYAAPR